MTPMPHLIIREKISTPPKPDVEKQQRNAISDSASNPLKKLETRRKVHRTSKYLFPQHSSGSRNKSDT